MKKAIIAISLIMSLGILVPRLALAATDFNLGSFYLAEGEVHGDNLVGGGTNINIEGTVGGDIIVGANTMVLAPTPSSLPARLRETLLPAPTPFGLKEKLKAMSGWPPIRLRSAVW
jgi:hypothetical protein